MKLKLKYLIMPNVTQAAKFAAVPILASTIAVGGTAILYCAITGKPIASVKKSVIEVSASAHGIGAVAAGAGLVFWVRPSEDNTFEHILGTVVITPLLTSCGLAFGFITGKIASAVLDSIEKYTPSLFSALGNAASGGIAKMVEAINTIFLPAAKVGSKCCNLYIEYFDAQGQKEVVILTSDDNDSDATIVDEVISNSSAENPQILGEVYNVANEAEA